MYLSWIYWGNKSDKTAAKHIKHLVPLWFIAKNNLHDDEDETKHEEGLLNVCPQE